VLRDFFKWCTRHLEKSLNIFLSFCFLSVSLGLRGKSFPFCCGQPVDGGQLTVDSEESATTNPTPQQPASPSVPNAVKRCHISIARKGGAVHNSNMKIVGQRTGGQASNDPVANYFRAEKLIQDMNLINPFPRPRGFVYKAKSWEAYAVWRQSQANPRLW
jgi:hypothetical protein